MQLNQGVLRVTEEIMLISCFRNTIFTALAVTMLFGAMGYFAPIQVQSNQLLSAIEKRGLELPMKAQSVAQSKSTIKAEQRLSVTTAQRKKMKRLASFLVLMPYLSRAGEG